MGRAKKNNQYAVRSYKIRRNHTGNHKEIGGWAGMKEAKIQDFDILTI